MSVFPIGCCGHAVLNCTWHTCQSKLCAELVYDLSSGEGGNCGWKRQVVRPVSNSFQVEEFVGKWFLPESAQHQLRTLRLPDLTYCRDPEGEVSNDGLCV
jgi:hypothetical protein